MNRSNSNNSNRPTASSIVEIANELVATQSKKEIVVQARAFGWRGDEARQPMLMIALYLATKLAESSESHSNTYQPQQQEEPQPQQQEEPQPQQQEEPQPQQPEEPQPQQPEEPQPEEPQPQQPEEPQPEEPQPQQPEEPQQPEQPQQPEEPEQPEEDLPEESSEEFRKLCKARGLTAPHRMLEKVWRLATKAKVNILLVGPAGTGKTMLSQQLAHLLDKSFSSLSCTEGMSESHLIGRLLPVGENGRFEYVASPFVNEFSKGGVFLLDEIDRSDANALMVLQSATANDFINVPHKLDNPHVLRHEECVLIAGANAIDGADDTYSTSGLLDGAFLDRWYPVAVGYDEAYMHGLFDLGRKSRRKSAAWTPGPQVDQDSLYQLRDFCMNAFRLSQSGQLNRIAATRFMQRGIAARRAGVAFEEVCRDLTFTWSDDECAQVGVSK